MYYVPGTQLHFLYHSFSFFSLSNQQHLFLRGSQILVDPDEVQFTSSGE